MEHERPAILDESQALIEGDLKASALRDLAFFVLEVLSAHGAELLDLELVAHRALVLRRRVIRAAAVATRHFDDVAHGDA